MIFRFSALLTLPLLGCSPLRAADEPPSPPPLKIVFRNIQWFPGGDKVANETRVAAMEKASGAPGGDFNTSADDAKFRSARMEIPAGKPSDHRPVVVE